MITEAVTLAPTMERPAQPAFISIIGATVTKDLQITRRYLPNLVGNVVQLTIRILFFLLFSVTISLNGSDLLTGNKLFVFFLSSLILWIFIGTALNTPLNAINNDLMNGTLEYLYSNPISRYAYYVGTVLAGAIVNMILFVPMFALLVLTAHPGLVNVIGILLSCAAMLGTIIALGIMIGLMALLWRQVNSLAGILFMLFEFLAGAYLPVSQFPVFIQWLAYGLPFTWGYDLVRYYSLNGQWHTLAPLWLEWSIVGLFALVFTTLSVILLKKAEQKAKQKGLHLI